MATAAKKDRGSTRLDFLAIDCAASDDEEKAIRDTVLAVGGAERIVPHVGEMVRAGHPAGASFVKEVAQARSLFGMHLEGYGLPGARLRSRTG